MPAPAATERGFARRSRRPSSRPARDPQRTLIIGGARSGKSREAELRLAGEPSVTYLAAGPWADGSWPALTARRTPSGPPGRGAPGGPAGLVADRESLDIADALRTADRSAGAGRPGALLIDGIGTWLAAIMDQAGAWAEPPATGALDQVADRIGGVIAAWRHASGLVVAVTDQVGEGLVPPYPAGRAFRDQLGWLNQRLAAESDVVLQVVAGRVQSLPG